MKKEMVRRLEAMERRRFGSPEIARFLVMKRLNLHDEADRLADMIRLDLNTLSTEALFFLIDLDDQQKRRPN
jgi:hypothetical protein